MYISHPGLEFKHWKPNITVQILDSHTNVPGSLFNNILIYNLKIEHFEREQRTLKTLRDRSETFKETV